MDEDLEYSFCRNDLGLILLVMRVKTKKLVTASLGHDEGSLLKLAEQDFQKLTKKTRVQYILRQVDAAENNQDFDKLQTHFLSLLDPSGADGDEQSSGKRRSVLEYEFLFGTPFQKKVWAELTKVPFGRTVTYGETARNIGLPNAIRAVGTAVGQNRLAVVVPCHRCLPSDGKIGKFRWGSDLKQKLLLQEKIIKKRNDVQ